MRAGKPVNIADEDCPLWHKHVKEVCHRCPLWIELRGTDPNTGQPVDEWGCSYAWMPTLTIENSQQSRQLGAAIESLRNEQVKIAENMMQAAAIAAQQMKRVK